MNNAICENGDFMLINPNIDFVYAGLFTSKGEWTHPDRTEKTFEMIYVTNGTVRLCEEQTVYTASKGSLLVLEAGKQHYGVGKESGVGFYWLHFLTRGMVLPFETRFFESFSDPHLFKELLHYVFLPTPQKALVNAILVRILAQLSYAESRPESAGKTAEEVYEWLRVNASAGLSAKTAAARFGFSTDHLSRLLKKQYGVGIKSVIDRFVLNRAKELLANTGLYVKEIAYELEFESDKAFIGFFKYHEGLYPGEWRDRYYKIHMNNR